MTFLPGRLFLAALLSLSLTSCAIGDGMAHVAKLASDKIGKKDTADNGANSGGANAAVPSAPSTVAQKPDDTQPPPPLAAASAAPPAITVETLPPVH